MTPLDINQLRGQDSATFNEFGRNPLEDKDIAAAIDVFNFSSAVYPEKMPKQVTHLTEDARDAEQEAVVSAAETAIPSAKRRKRVDPALNDSWFTPSRIRNAQKNKIDWQNLLANETEEQSRERREKQRLKKIAQRKRDKNKIS